MTNLNYNRSRSREYAVLHLCEQEGWLAFRSAGSHSFADIVAVRPSKCGHGDDFEVRFIQIKVSVDLKDFKKEVKVIETPIGMVNATFMHFPIHERRASGKRSTRKVRHTRK